MNLLHLAYIREIIHYIENEKEYDSVKNNENGVLDYLNSIQYRDISKIAEEMINDDYLNEQLNTTIGDYLYNYREVKDEKEN